jgi:PAS domain-containing protein
MPGAEYELAQFFDFSRDLVCIAGFDGYYKLVNASFERVLGYSREELLSRPFMDFVHPYRGDRVLRRRRGAHHSAKHARAASVAVAAWVEAGTLRVEVRDDGIGGARPDGSGLQGLGDRLAAVDGRLQVESPANGGTLGAAAIPVPADATDS